MTAQLICGADFKNTQERGRRASTPYSRASVVLEPTEHYTFEKIVLAPPKRICLFISRTQQNEAAAVKTALTCCQCNTYTLVSLPIFNMYSDVFLNCINQVFKLFLYCVKNCVYVLSINIF